MKKFFVMALAAVAFAGAQHAAAQSYRAYRMALTDSPAAPAYAMPYTTVKVYITVEKEITRPGPYARYAQKYLGVMAPLAERETYNIAAARLDYTDPERMVLLPSAQDDFADGQQVILHIDGGSEFTRALPDRMSSIERSLEDMARETANNIFTLRKRRFDLVSGEAGENVYGAGLQAAIDEMARLENEYLSLFLGKQTVVTTVHELDVVPQADKTSYVVCRYTAASGILSDSDLSGQPIVLMLAPEGGVQVAAARTSSRVVDIYRVADFAEARLMFESDELAKTRLPIYQFGITVSVPVVERK